MDSPSRRSVARSQRRSHNASPYSRSKSVAGGLSRSSELPLHAAQPASAIARTSSIRSLFNLISSPFRSAAPAAQREPSDDGFSASEAESDDGFSEEDERERVRMQHQQQDDKFAERRGYDGFESDGRTDDDKLTSEGIDYAVTISHAATDAFRAIFAPIQKPTSGHQWAAANPLAAFSPRVKREGTHAHALLQMEPSPARSVPRYSNNDSGMTRSSTMPLLDKISRGDGARRVLRAADVDPVRGGRILEESEDAHMGDSSSPEDQRLFTPGARMSSQALFHPGTATPSRPTTLAGSINGGFARSTANLSFLSPSRFSARNSSTGSSFSSTAAVPPPSPGTYSFASRPGTGTPARGSSTPNGTPARRRPIYVGPGTGSPASLRKRTPAMALEFLRGKEEEAAASGGAGDASGGTPGKRRRIDGSGPETEEARVERELGGLFGPGTGSSVRAGGLSSSFSVPANLAASGSTSRRNDQPSSPFTFKPPPAPAAPVASPLATAPKRPFSTLPARVQLKNPSLVAPSPLRQSTSFGRDSPDGKAPADVPVNGAGGKRKERTESATLLLGLINGDKQKNQSTPPVEAPKPPAATPAKPSGLRTSSTPAIQNPYQAIASPSPRRNARRSVAATNRSSKLAASTTATVSSPATGRKKAVTALDLIEQDVRSKEGPPASPSPTASKRPSVIAEAEPKKSVEASPAIKQPAPVNATAIAPPAWASTPPPVVHFAPPPTVSSLAKDVSMDGESPTKRTLDLFKTLESPAFAKTSAAASNGSSVPKPSAFMPAAAAPEPVISAALKTAAPLPSFSTSTTTTPIFTAPSTDPKEEAARKDKHLLPIFTFAFSSTATPLPTSAAQAQAMREAKAVSKASLPAFDLLAPSASSDATAGPSSALAPASTGSFYWAAVGMAPPKPAADKWTCGVCMISNDADRIKCAACEEPAPKKAASASGGGGFDWSAAGMQKPSQPAADSWTCSVCSIVNTADKAKCAACEEPQPKSTASASASAPAPPAPSANPSAGFNWAMAGVKPPAAKPADSWTCGVCMLTNDPDKAQCPACEEPRPKLAPTAPTAPAASASTPAPAPASAFNWGAAGMSAPAKKAGWECSVCMCQNDTAAAKCIACESPK